MQEPPAQGGITCAPLAIDFGTVAGNIGATLPVVCTNTSELSVEVIALATSATVFTAVVDPGSSSTIGPGQSTQIDVTYLPTTTETDSGTLTIALSGEVAAVVVSLTGTAIVENVCDYSITPSMINWGEVAVGVVLDLVVSINNFDPSACPLTISDIRLSGATSNGSTFKARWRRRTASRRRSASIHRNPVATLGHSSSQSTEGFNPSRLALTLPRAPRASCSDQPASTSPR
jgi:hypothetical protein